MHCSTCGSAIRENATFCVQCGSKITTTDDTYSPKANFIALRTIAFVIGTLAIAMILGSLILFGFMVTDTETVFPAWTAPVGAIAGVLILGFAELILLFVNIEDQTWQILHWVRKGSNK